MMAKSCFDLTVSTSSLDELELCLEAFGLKRELIWERGWLLTPVVI